MDWYGVSQEYGYYSAEMQQNMLSEMYQCIEINAEKIQEDTARWLRSTDERFDKNSLLHFEFLHHSQLFRGSKYLSFV